MLFNSYAFILGFLPLTLGVFFWVGARGRPRARHRLAGAGVPVFLRLVESGLSRSADRVPGRQLRPGTSVVARVWRREEGAPRASRGEHRIEPLSSRLFQIRQLLRRLGQRLGRHPLVHGRHRAALAISFFTFQQIAYLVDVYRGEAHEYSFLHYALFVTFFPQLIAGPIVHHKEMLPQFARAETFRSIGGISRSGCTLFAIGLFKKVVLADGSRPTPRPSLTRRPRATPAQLLRGLGGRAAYTLQLYFDFSGYSDMAMGLARMFGIALPLNFHSPYKAVNIVEFWRRWHMTLSRFLRDYLYIALGGNRQGAARRYANLMITMLLGGLWHGAGWTFVIWGGMHGILLVVNHAWHALRRWIGWHRVPWAGSDRRPPGF